MKFCLSRRRHEEIQYRLVADVGCLLFTLFRGMKIFSGNFVVLLVVKKLDIPYTGGSTAMSHGGLRNDVLLHGDIFFKLRYYVTYQEIILRILPFDQHQIFFSHLVSSISA